MLTLSFLTGFIKIVHEESTMKKKLAALYLSLVITGLGAPASWAESLAHMMVTPGELKWTDVASLPAGAKIAVIEGDLKNPTPFTFRLKLPANYTVAPHTHPTIEHVTVISGTFHFGPGDKIDEAKATALKPGSFAVFPPGHSMFGWTKEETVIQVHGVGPWGINYVNPADDPRKK